MTQNVRAAVIATCGPLILLVKSTGEPKWRLVRYRTPQKSTQARHPLWYLTGVKKKSSDFRMLKHVSTKYGSFNVYSIELSPHDMHDIRPYRRNVITRHFPLHEHNTWRHVQDLDCLLIASLRE